MYRYSYDGPVMAFDVCLEDHYKCETVAKSESKAKSNMAFRWKKEHNRDAKAKISLPGKVTKEEIK